MTRTGEDGLPQNQIHTRKDIQDYLGTWQTHDHGTKPCTQVVERLLGPARAIGLASPIAKALGRVLEARYTALHADETLWSQEWVEVVLKWLAPTATTRAERSARERAFFTYILPAITKIEPRSTLALLSEIDQPEQQRVRVALLRAAKSYDLLTIGGHLASCELLSRGLVDYEAGIRLDSAALIIESGRTTVPFTNVEYGLLTRFYTSNMNVHAAEFNQKFLLLMSTMIARCRDSLYSAARDAKLMHRQGARDKDVASLDRYIEESRSFLLELIHFSAACICPASSYSRTLTAISFLIILAQSGIDPLCRTMASNYGPRPDNKNVVFPFELVIFSTTLLNALLMALASPFVAIREAVSSLLTCCPQLPGNPQAHLDRAFMLCLNTREAEADAGSRLIALIWELEQASGLDLPNGSAGDAAGRPAALPSFLRNLLCSLQNQISLAKADLVLASQEAPMHGTLVALRRIVEGIRFESLTKEQCSLYLAQVLACIDQAWDATRPFLAYQAPEGHIVATDSDGTESADEDPAVVSQVISSCSWRTMKAAADFLSAVCAHSQKERSHLQIDAAMAHQMAAMYHDWILTCRHRGAFSAIGESYGEFCRAIARIGMTAEGLLRKWLEDHLDVATSADISLIGTRRSAGLPLMILAVLDGAKKVSGRPRADQDEPAGTRLFGYAMSRLFECARRHVDAEDEQKIVASVHSYNIIKSIISDGRLGKDATSCYNDAFLLCVEGFTSTSWDIRNASMMLYGALVHRTLGEGRNFGIDQNHTGGHSLTEFFASYPGLFDLVLLKMKVALDGETARMIKREHHHTTGVHSLGSSLFPLLLMLGRLRPSQEKASLDTDALRIVVRDCLGLRDWRVRQACGEALVALLSPEDLVREAQNLMTDLSDSTANLRHGQLLLLRSACPLYSKDVFQPILEHLGRLVVSLFGSLRDSRWLEISIVLDIFDQHDYQSEAVVLGCHSLLAASEAANRSAAFRPLCLAACARGIATYRPDQVGLPLRHKCYEVRQAALDRTTPDTILRAARHGTSLAPIIREIALCDPVEQCQRTALRLYAQLDSFFLASDWNAFSALLDHPCGTVREQALVLVASLLSRLPTSSDEKSLRLEFFGEILLKQSDPFHSAYTREAVLEAILKLDMLFRPAQRVDHGSELMMIYGILLNMVLDDDEEIRRRTCHFVVQALAGPEARPLLPEGTTKLIFDYLEEHYLGDGPDLALPVQQAAIEHLCAEIVDTKGRLGLASYASLDKLLHASLEANHVLFAIERPNTFRESMLTPRESTRVLTAWLDRAWQKDNRAAPELVMLYIEPWLSRCRAVAQRLMDDERVGSTGLSSERYELQQRLALAMSISSSCKWERGHDSGTTRTSV